MSNTSCAPPSDINRFTSWNFLIAQCVGVIAVTVTVVTSIWAAQLIRKKSMFERSTKILLYQSLIYASIFQFLYGHEALTLLYNRFYLISTPCELLQSEKSCVRRFELLLICTNGMIYGQTGLMLERAFATFAKDYSQYIKPVGVMISIFVFIFSGISAPLIVWDDPLEKFVFACYVIPKQSIMRASYYYCISTILVLFNLMVTGLIMFNNKRREYDNRCEITPRFQQRQAIDSTETICFLALSLFVFLLIYSIGICVLLNIRSIISPIVFNFFITWVYTIPFVSLMIPLLLIYRIKTIRGTRAQAISGQVNTKQSQDEHMKQMNVMWN